MSKRAGTDSASADFDTVQLIDNNLSKAILKKFHHKDINIAIYPEGTSESATTPLLYAINEEKIECVKALLLCAYMNDTFYDLESCVKACISTGSITSLNLLFYYRRSIKFNMKNVIKYCGEHYQFPMLNIINILSKHTDAMYDFTGRDGLRPISYLAKMRTEDTLEEALALINFCVQLKCSVNRISVSEKHPLAVALQTGNVNYAKALIMSDANISIFCDNGNSLLYESFFSCPAGDMFEFLLRNGANSRDQNATGSQFQNDTTLKAAIRYKCFNTICQIIELDKNIPNLDMPIVHYILAVFASSGKYNLPKEKLLSMVKCGINIGFGINHVCTSVQAIVEPSVLYKGHTILHLAFRFFGSEFCEELIKLGADIHAVTDYNQCMYSLVMDCALVRRDSDEDVKNKFAILHKYGLDIQQEIPMMFPQHFDRFTSTLGNLPQHPIQIAVTRKKRKLAEFLFQFFAAHEKVGFKELQIAFATGNIKIIKGVLKSIREEELQEVRSVDLRCIFYERLPSYIAGEKIYRQITLPLLSPYSHIPEVFQEPPTRLLYQDLAYLLSTLVNGGCSLISADEYGNSLLHYAAISSIFETVFEISKFVGLIKSLRGEQLIDRENNRGQTALHFALSKKFEHDTSPATLWAKILVDNGARVDLQTHQGHSALHMAIHSSYPSSFIKQLITKGGHYMINSRVESLPSPNKWPFVPEVVWPTKAPKKYYSVTPLTISILGMLYPENPESGKRNAEIFQLLVNSGAIIRSTEIFNSIVINNFNSLSLANWIFEIAVVHKQLQLFLFVKYDYKQPMLEYIFYEHIDRSTPFDFNAADLQKLAENYIARGYDINRPSCYPHVIEQLIKHSLAGSKRSTLYGSLFKFLLKHTSDERLLEMYMGKDALITHALKQIPRMSFKTYKSDDFVRVSFIRQLLRRYSPSSLNNIHFKDYKYRKGDDLILKYLLFTGARKNLIREWRSVENYSYCGLCSEENQIARSAFERSFRQPPTLLGLSFAAIKKTDDILHYLQQHVLPDSLKQLVTFFLE